MGFDELGANYTLVKSHEYSVDSNWKVYIENYCDGGYHVPILHPKLTSFLNISTYETKIYDHYSIQSVESNRVVSENRIGNRGLYAYIYPNVMINKYGDWVDINICFPISPKKNFGII